MAISIIAIGIVLAIIGTLKDDTVGPLAGQTLLQKLIALMGQAWNQFTRGRNKWARLAGLGMLLVFLGFAFLLSSGITAIVSAVAGQIGGGGSTTPPTDTPSPSST